ncbi:alpha/beta hydrolase family esterase [Mycobacterium kyorinense]|uniref:Polyhydroxybutyrate depolymerase n=1 Tax=Mycobacterium kyorinense TaxID=487514 RepID=A0A1X1XUS1_9MYCO|nr:PHB depolymerase family esterase [Mycobacterium kyorinense]ORW02605.1 polyhydroxybutyrate depolymerase [Mycobacterium kyorinense]
MFARLAALLGVLATVAACSASPPATAALPDGTSVHTISVGGLDRTYRVYKPAGLPESAPLVVMLHGGFGSARQAEKAYGWNQLADSMKFLVAYPDGVGRAWNTGGGCCGQPDRDGVDDVGFITATVTEISHAIGVDASRIYATGISNGGIMAYTLACHTGMFAAIGPDAATQLDPCSSPHRTSVMHIHGTGDQNIRYNGGRGAGVAHIDGPPVPQVNAFWRNVDHCAPPTTSTERRVTTSTAECPDNRSVVLMTVDGGGHEWPQFATPTLWRFFAGHAD